MIPEEDTSDYLFKTGSIESVREPTLTYRMDKNRKRIIGKIDGKDALAQAVYKELSTEKYKYAIYDTYGIQREDLYGMPKMYVYILVKERIKEVLKADDRVLDVIDFEIVEEKSKDEDLTISFVVVSIYGDIEVKGVLLY